eukprot:gnl/MRDRNA2_/MRDRNA2_81981_c0_seq1.p1 gnl/MRDRNA2_/MRDRNA2_81981_c0~~gnl/MRDRNA2_/MRDRNA2_81981_c0_seq1.p1  ORF type:complete len:203 (-),score=20.28 gnl/MRDRNA2_/MRDRNA2_81981_c0_seq1:134-742(-)
MITEWMCDSILLASRNWCAMQHAKFEPLSRSNLAWSVSPLKGKDIPLLEALAAAAIPPISAGSYATEYCSNIAWALSVCVSADVPALDSISAAALANLKHTSVADERNFISMPWALACLVVVHRPLFTSIAEQAIRTITEFDSTMMSALIWSAWGCSFPAVDSLCVMAWQALNSEAAWSVVGFAGFASVDDMQCEWHGSAQW